MHKAHKNLIKYAVLGVVFAVALFLFGCEKAECKKDADCEKEHFIGNCADEKCFYAPAPGECGNGLCDTGEDQCSCSQDCGACEGRKGVSMELRCLQNKCVPIVLSQRPLAMTNELSSAGDRFMITSNFNQPFNFKSDKFKVRISLSSQSEYVSNIKISRMLVSGLTDDRRTVNIGEKFVSKFLWGVGSGVEEELILGFPTSSLEGALTNLLLKIDYDYTVKSSTGTEQKSATLQQKYTNVKFQWANPDAVYPCPESCDDLNQGTQDFCGPETGYFCEHKPLAGACGNFICDAEENKCSCQRDCGPCSGKAGTYVFYACSENNECLVNLNPNVIITPVSLFDDRKLSLFHLQNNYKYSNPFNIKTDAFVLDLSLYEVSPSVSKVTVKTIRLLEGTKEIASLETNKEFATVGTRNTVEVRIDSLPLPEQEKYLTLGVWYTYTKEGQDFLGNYNKPFGKIVLINTD